MATTGGRGGGRDPGRDKGGSVGRQMVPQWDERAVGEGQGQRHVDVSDDQENSSSFQHSGSEEQLKRTGERSETAKYKKALNVTELSYSQIACHKVYSLLQSQTEM